MKTQKPRQLNDSVYEFYRPDGDFKMEIVAFHGLRFSKYRDAYETTWELENGNGCWLRDSLPADFPDARILSLSYDSCAKVSDKAGRMSFSNLGMILVQDLIHLADVGQRGCPVVLVGHCLGGLVIKQLCTEAEKQYDQAPDGSSKGRLDNFLTNVRVIASIDTPQAGSALGDYLVKFRECDGPALEYLNKSSPALRKLTSEFDSLVVEREWARVCFWHCWITREWDSLQLKNCDSLQRPVSGLEVVGEGSARLGKETEFYTVQADHSTRAWGSSSPRDSLTDFLDGIISKTEIPVYPQSKSNRSSPTIVEGERRSDRPRERRVSDSLYKMYEPVGGKHAKLELIVFPGSFKEDSYKTTWMTEDNKHCWLQSWLPDAFPESRIFAVSYRTDLNLVESVDLFLLCETLIAEIIRNRKDTGLPLILIGHCLGGIVIKMLCNQVEQEISRSDGKHDQGSCRELLRSIRGVGYYATSHLSHCSCQGGGNKIIISKAGDCDLGRINADYSYNVTNLGWKELALGETQPTEQGSRKIFFVDESSASHGIQRNSFFPVAADHFSVCKPKSPSSNSFQYLVHFIHTTMNEAQYRNMNVRRKKRRGIALVIGMELERPGSMADRRGLDAMADYLQFKAIMVLDRKASCFPLVIQEILEAEKKAMEEDECILVCVNAHGDVSADGIHYIRDNDGNGIQLISDVLKPIADCPVLDGKPKVFVVNSCRGISGEIDATTGLPQDQNELQGVDDCLLMYSTKLDTESWRRETGYEQGTLFVSELTYHISLLYQTTDVQDIFKRVEDKIPELARRYGVEQSPVMFCTLRKRLSWRPR